MTKKTPIIYKGQAWKIDGVNLFEGDTVDIRGEKVQLWINPKLTGLNQFRAGNYALYQIIHDARLVSVGLFADEED